MPSIARIMDAITDTDILASSFVSYRKRPCDGLTQVQEVTYVTRFIVSKVNSEQKKVRQQIRKTEEMNNKLAFNPFNYKTSLSSLFTAGPIV